MAQCKHCLLMFDPHDESLTVGDDIFCCHACMAIYALINDEGLGTFYDNRDTRSWMPGPSENVHLDLAAFEDVIKEAGDGVLEADILIDGIRCASCVWLNEKALARTDGVHSATINYATHRARIRFDSSLVSIAEVLRRIAMHGYTPRPYHADEAAIIMQATHRDLLMRFGTAAFFSMQLMLYSAALYAGYFEGMDPKLRRTMEFIALGLCTPVLFYSGWPFIRASVNGLRRFNFNMDVLVTIGAGAAYVYSIYNMVNGAEVYFDTSAMLVSFVLLGRLIEAGAKGRASEAVSRLLGIAPAEAIVIDAGGSRQSVPVSSIKTGQLIEVRPGGRLPLDGLVVEGGSQCDESMLTGESLPVSKADGDEVYAGTLNGEGSFIFRVTRTGQDTVLSGIVRAVEDAQGRRAPVQALADRVVGYFVPSILGLAAMTFVVRMYLGAETSQALMNAVAVLVIACPCALGLATPLAIVVATTSGAKRGILIKGGDVIERSGSLTHIVLDKTGTVTMGSPELTSIRSIGGMSDEDALALMASLELRSEHPVGRAVVRAASHIELSEDVKEFRAHSGLGVSATIDGKQVLGGSREFLSEQGIAGMDTISSAHEEQGRSVVWLAFEGRLCGEFVISDPVRPEAAEVVAELKSMGKAVSIFTGDNPSTALAVGKLIGVSDIRAALKPMQKAAAIRELKLQGKGVLMAGDGINDAPALVEADVGVAVGRATDVALQSADMVLMRGDLHLLPEALRLSSKALRVIRQNVFWAFAYNIVAVPLAVAGLLHPIIAALAMALSSISVVVNSLRARLR